LSCFFSHKHQSSAQKWARRLRVMWIIKSHAKVPSVRIDWRTAAVVINSRIFCFLFSRRRSYRRRKQIYSYTQHTRSVVFTLIRNISFTSSRCSANYLSDADPLIKVICYANFLWSHLVIKRGFRIVWSRPAGQFVTFISKTRLHNSKLILNSPHVC